MWSFAVFQTSQSFQRHLERGTKHQDDKNEKEPLPVIAIAKYKEEVM